MAAVAQPAFTLHPLYATEGAASPEAPPLADHEMGGPFGAAGAELNCGSWGVGQQWSTKGAGSQGALKVGPEGTHAGGAVGDAAGGGGRALPMMAALAGGGVSTGAQLGVAGGEEGAQSPPHSRERGGAEAAAQAVGGHTGRGAGRGAREGVGAGAGAARSVGDVLSEEARGFLRAEQEAALAARNKELTDSAWQSME